uniref:Putative transmembrane anti-sigma factor n=1 Tax=Solibacter usitatus (strain Ellin6076) TaxID=234267 RepID=Q02A37_SOLUE
MTCEEAHTYLSAHLDDELDVATSLEMERHLAACPNCRRAHAANLALRDAIRGADLYYEPPPHLAKKIRAAVAPPSRFAWRWPAVAALAAAAALFAVLWLRSNSEPRLVAEVVASHVRSLQAGHLVDVPSSDRHTVKPWFQGKLDFSPPVPDIPELVGGRLDYLNGRPVAALVYQRRRHQINVFVWPSPATAPLSLHSTNGYQVVHWSTAGMEWWAVSDMNGPELMDFAKATMSH